MIFLVAGLLTVNRSKIKCLAERPSCSSCRKRNQPCEYDIAPRPASRPQGNTPVLQPASQGQGHTTGLPQPHAHSEDLTTTITIDHHSNANDHTVNLRDPTPAPPQPVFDFSSTMPHAAYPPGLDSFTWIFEDNLDDVFQSTLPSPWHDLLATDFDFSTGKDEAQPPETLEQEDWEIDESSEEIDELPQPTPQDRCNPDDVWPMEWHAASAQCLTLPNLEPSNQDLDMKTGSFYPIQSVTESMRARLLNSVRLPLERVPWQTTSLANFPSKDKLDHCIDLFFRHFDRVCLAAMAEVPLQ